MREARPGVETLFTTRERLPLSTRRAREIFETLGQVARVPNAFPHRCRNTNATEYLSEQPGAELALQARLGHLSREMLSTYVSQADRGAAAARSPERNHLDVRAKDLGELPRGGGSVH